MGSGALNRSDADAVQALVSDLADKVGAVSKDWNGYNILHLHASRVGALDLGFLPKGKSGKDFAKITKAAKDGKIKFTYLLGLDDFEDDAFEKSFVVYQGHHGDKGAAHADVILPGVAYTEKDATYVNMEGRPQRAKKAVSAPGEAKEDWKILRALSDILDQTLPYDNIHGLRQAMIKESKVFEKIDVCEPSKWTKAGTSGKLLKSDFSSAMPTNYYQTNVITRASKTMAECVEAFIKNSEPSAKRKKA